MTLHLTRTHQSRWIAQLPRTRATAGIITLLSTGDTPAVFRAEARISLFADRRLLQDSDTLELAFARIIAAHARAAAETVTSITADETERAA